MLYHLNELKNASLWPTHMLSEAATSFLNASDQDHSTLYGRFLQASAEMVERNTRVYPKPAFGIHSVKRENHVIQISEKILIDKAFCSLKFFERKSAETTLNKTLKEDPILLIAAPLSGHFATLLRDTVFANLPYHQTYITDWKDSKHIPLSEGNFTLENYVEYLLDFIRSLSSQHGGRRIHILAVCQPSVPVLMAVSLLALYKEHCQPLSMTLMGGPIDTRINPGQVNEFSSSHSIEWFQKNIISTIPSYYKGAGRKVCPGFILLGGFMSLNPERHQEASQKLFQHLVQGDMGSVDHHRKFYDEYRAVMDIPADYFLDSIYHSFQNHTLARGKMMWKNLPINPAIITDTALLTVEGEKDDISCPGQTLAAHTLCQGLPKHKKKSILQKNVGHYGIFNGRRWREFIQPEIAAFIRAQES